MAGMQVISASSGVTPEVYRDGESIRMSVAREITDGRWSRRRGGGVAGDVSDHRQPVENKSVHRSLPVVLLRVVMNAVLLTGGVILIHGDGDRRPSQTPRFTVQR
ncbi:hypothetical protein O1L55_13480 [Streptomyces albulus]|nr:hypothetical protein [Streptomyces noursei]